MASIVCWGIELNLWTSYLLLIVLQNAFEKQYPGLIAAKDENDYIIYGLTGASFYRRIHSIIKFCDLK